MTTIFLRAFLKESSKSLKKKKKSQKHLSTTIQYLVEPHLEGIRAAGIIR